jgi:hypothetical protein
VISWLAQNPYIYIYEVIVIYLYSSTGRLEPKVQIQLTLGCGLLTR